MLLGTRNNKRLHHLELLHFSCHSLRDRLTDSCAHTGWQIWEQEVPAVGKVQHESPASQQPLLGACVTSPCGAVGVADVFSERQAAKRGTRDQRKYLCTAAFLKVCFFMKDTTQGWLFNLFIFSHFRQLFFKNRMSCYNCSIEWVFSGGLAKLNCILLWHCWWIWPIFYFLAQ